MAADNSGMIKIALFAGAGYLAYRQGWLSMLGLGTPAAASPAPAVPATPAPNPNAIVGANSLDAIYTRMLAAAKVSSANVDEWGYYLNNELAKTGKVAPDPMPIFQTAVPNFDRAQKLSAAQYWAVMSPALKTQLGLSGLGIYGGLGQLLRGYR
jgi:hypothetical protein